MTNSLSDIAAEMATESGRTRRERMDDYTKADALRDIHTLEVAIEQTVPLLLPEIDRLAAYIEQQDAALRVVAPSDMAQTIDDLRARLKAAEAEREVLLVVMFNRFSPKELEPMLASARAKLDALEEK
jgi:hypothetical protein